MIHFIHHAYNQEPLLVSRDQKLTSKKLGCRFVRISAAVLANVFSIPQQICGLASGAICGAAGALIGAVRGGFQKNILKKESVGWLKGFRTGGNTGARVGLIAGNILFSVPLFPLAVISYATSRGISKKSAHARSQFLISKATLALEHRKETLKQRKPESIPQEDLNTPLEPPKSASQLLVGGKVSENSESISVDSQEESDNSLQISQEIPKSPPDDQIQIPQCPLNLQSYFDQAPNDFKEKILHSPLYNAEEKQELFNVARSTYSTGPTDWVKAVTTRDYLKALSLRYPQFRTFEMCDSKIGAQIKTEDFNAAKINQILDLLPSNLGDALQEHTPRIFGQAVQVNGDHRTVFIIDLDNKTVEYYNSFSSDEPVKLPLSKLAAALTQKYGVAFTYKNVTADLALQNDVYQCGIWACKFVEERLEQGKGFNLRSCEKCQIADYRKEVFDELFKFNFYKTIGQKRQMAYERTQWITYPNLPQYYYKALTDFQKNSFYNILPEYYRWCETGEMPLSLLNTLNDLKEEAAVLEKIAHPHV